MTSPESYPDAGIPDLIPMIPLDRDKCPLNDAEFAELSELVHDWPNFDQTPENPRYKRWEELQRKADSV